MGKTGKGIGKVVGAVVGVIALAFVTSAMVGIVVNKLNTQPTEFEYVTPASGDGEGYYRHAYEDLNEDEKKIYSVIFHQLYSQPQRIEIPSLGNADLEKVFEAVSFDNPDLFNLGVECKVYAEGDKTYFETDYKISCEEYENMRQEVNVVVDRIVREASKYSTIYEKEKFVHDYIIDNCSYVDYEDSTMANTVYGCLVEGRASCEGYSRAFQYIISALNIDNRLVTGESADDSGNYINHMWNYVVLDGEGYFVDLTWDDPRAQNNVLRHTYFNVTSADISLKHRNIMQSLPLCEATDYNYFVYEKLFLDMGDGEQFSNAVSEAVKKSLATDAGCVELRFSDSEVMANAMKTLFDNGVAYEIYTSAGIVSDSDSAQVYYSSNELMNTICLFF